MQAATNDRLGEGLNDVKGALAAGPPDIGGEQLRLIPSPSFLLSLAIYYIFLFDRRR